MRNSQSLQFVFILRNSTINDHYDSMHQDDDPENLRHKCNFYKLFFFKSF